MVWGFLVVGDVDVGNGSMYSEDCCYVGYGGRWGEVVDKAGFCGSGGFFYFLPVDSSPLMVLGWFLSSSLSGVLSLDMVYMH